MNEKRDVEVIIEKIDKVFERLEQMDNHINSLEDKVNSVMISYENILNSNIKLIAFGQGDLGMKIEYLINNSNDIEFIKAKVNILEGDFGRLKGKSIS